MRSGKCRLRINVSLCVRFPLRVGIPLCVRFPWWVCFPEYVRCPYVRNWFSSIWFLYTCYISGSFGGFYWVILRHVFGLFWQLLLLDMFGLGRIIVGLVLLFFPCSFLVIFHYYYLSYSYIILG